MKTKILSLAAAALISAGIAGTANTAAADTTLAVSPAVATAETKAQASNVGARFKLRIRRGYYYGYYPRYRYIGSYRHCKRLLVLWKHYGSYIAKKKFFRYGCARFYY